MTGIAFEEISGAMKVLLSLILLVALLALTTEGARGNTVAARECVPSPKGCCDERDHAPPAAPASSLCQQCCVTCCAIVPAGGIQIQAPSSDPTKYLRIHLGALSRNEQPPVPPPRLS